jgi:dTDP-4-dehydrorhamnose reductase
VKNRLEKSVLWFIKRSKEVDAMTKPLELWAGLECTVNRVGERYYDQIKRNGHFYRLEDLERIAELGVKTLRYPVLWEHVAPEDLDTPNWSWTDERLNRLKALGIKPIAGLLHHGGGPRYTSLIDSEFPEKLAAYARMVATRYPWLNLYTPVNEPLTTARFSGLYGHWYPHGRDTLIFMRCLLNECKGTVLAMREIRKINPEAQLIQTEDIGKTYSTPLLKYQADLENERHWLSFDLLCGRLKPGMLMWDYLLDVGVTEAELAWFIENPCPPDVVGINHYLTSDRYLDESLDMYPVEFHGGNGIHAYADEAAIRVNLENYGGISEYLKEAWERYELPIAITEAHLGCTREEQLRWLKDFWESSERVKLAGADIRAVTVWSLLGAFDWNTLVTQDNGFYEPGVFDIRGETLRPTALARMVQHLAQREDFHFPLLDVPGWWNRTDRFFYPEFSAPHSYGLAYHKPSQDCAITGACNRTTRHPLIIIGANGTLGKAFARICDIRGIPYYLLSRAECNICDAEQVRETLSHFSPWAVVNAAGYVRVDDAEDEEAACWRDNVDGPTILAEVCAGLNLPLVTFSSDLVFNGDTNRPYQESDQPAPLNVYGLSKATAEKKIGAVMPSALIIRTSAFFGPWDNYNFVTIGLNHLAAGKAFTAADDIFVSPTYVPDLVNACLDLLIDGETGIWHLTNHTETTWFELAYLAASMQGVDTRRLQAVTHQEQLLLNRAKRPQYSVLGTERCRIMPHLENAMSRYVKEVRLAIEPV